jgi:alkylhydroperoxidase/carboxymuconolactone decarboxylase family protein YurZ
MADDPKKRAKNLVARSKKKRGYLPFWLEYMSEHDVDYLEAYEEHYEKLFDRDTALPPKFKQLVVLSALAVSREDYGMQFHIRRAFEMGITQAEMVNTFQTAAWHTGALTLVHGMKVLLAIIEERKQAGKPTP